MNKPLTKRTTDYSDKEAFSFGFFCDICGKEWKSHVVPFEMGGMAIEHEEARQLLWVQGHNAAFTAANLEAQIHFNRCPVCGKWVCDDCISLKDRRRETCKECGQ